MTTLDIAAVPRTCSRPDGGTPIDDRNPLAALIVTTERASIGGYVRMGTRPLCSAVNLEESKSFYDTVAEKFDSLVQRISSGLHGAAQQVR